MKRKGKRWKLTGFLLLGLFCVLWYLASAVCGDSAKDAKSGSTETQTVSQSEERKEIETEAETRLETEPESEIGVFDVEEPQTDSVPEADSMPAKAAAADLADTADGQTFEREVRDILERMTLEEKTAQLFMITPEALLGIADVTAAGEMTEAALRQYPVGGLIYFENNLISEEQVRTMLKNVQAYSEEITGLPLFLGVDEEGGTVARISGRGFDVPSIEDMAKIGAARDYERAKETAGQIGAYLKKFGFNVDFAPCADVLTNPENTVVARRSFGADAEMAAEMTGIQIKELQKQGVSAVPKHFPGHGATSGDSHQGYAYTEKTLEELFLQELLPFQRAIEAQTDFIMVGHIACPAVTGTDAPASLSPYLITEVLQKQMGFAGLVITDALNMQAIQQMYDAGQAAKMALQAGVDILLMPADFSGAYAAVLQAVRDGEIPEERIDASVQKIIRLKWKKKKA